MSEWPAWVDRDYQIFGAKSYAQHGDDIILLAIFHRLGIDRPSYLDLGAYQPFHISNTGLLYERGSRGINVEADPDLIDVFRAFRPQDVNLNVGVGPERGRLTFYRAHNPGRSSFDRAVAAEAGIAAELEVDVVTLADIVDRHAGGQCPDLLSIDVEGLDLPILQGVDFGRHAPKVICVEAMVGTADHSAALKRLMADRGYFLHFRAGANMMFVREELRHRLY